MLDVKEVRKNWCACGNAIFSARSQHLSQPMELIGAGGRIRRNRGSIEAVPRLHNLFTRKDEICNTGADLLPANL
jgi:hypothetical protein